MFTFSSYFDGLVHVAEIKLGHLEPLHHLKVGEHKCPRQLLRMLKHVLLDAEHVHVVEFLLECQFFAQFSYGLRFGFGQRVVQLL